MMRGHCFQNAFELASAQPDELLYVEGFATTGRWVHYHAWCIDQEGSVVDPTWRWSHGNDCHRDHPKFGAYLGLIFSLEKVALSSSVDSTCLRECPEEGLSEIPRSSSGC